MALQPFTGHLEVCGENLCETLAFLIQRSPKVELEAPKEPHAIPDSKPCWGFPC